MTTPDPARITGIPATVITSTLPSMAVIINTDNVLTPIIKDATYYGRGIPGGNNTWHHTSRLLCEKWWIHPRRTKCDWKKTIRGLHVVDEREGVLYRQGNPSEEVIRLTSSREVSHYHSPRPVGGLLRYGDGWWWLDRAWELSASRI